MGRQNSNEQMAQLEYIKAQIENVTNEESPASEVISRRDTSEEREMKDSPIADISGRPHDVESPTPAPNHR